MTDLGDGLGPFIPVRPLEDISQELKMVITDFRQSTTYGDSIEAKAKDELSSIRGKTNEEAKLVQKEKELQERIGKCYTKSSNPKVRAKYKENRDKLKSQLLKVQDELADMRMSKNRT